jgi:hypothetical protein
MTALSIPEAIVACVTMICITVFLTAVSLKGMDIGYKYKNKDKML